MQEKWIFAYLYDGEYRPEQITDDNRIEGLEYTDVISSEYQLWNWPSGDIYDIKTDSAGSDRAFQLPGYSDHDGSPWAVFRENNVAKIDAVINSKA